MRRIVGLTLAVGVGLLVSAAPAAAKFWAFEMAVAETDVKVGQTIVLDARVAPELADQAAAIPDMVPPVEVYRTADLPATGEMSGLEEPVATPTFRHLGEGRFRGEVVLSEPGSYQIVSMGRWNYQLEGYPDPIPVSVVAAEPKPLAATEPPSAASDDGISPLISAGAVLALAAAALLWRSRRGSPAPASP